MQNFQTSIVIAITGGIGSGKTTVAKYLEQQGFPVIFTDDIAKQVIATDKTITEKIKQLFGDEVIDESNKLNTELLSTLVFGHDEAHKTALKNLNSIVHPAVIDVMITKVDVLETKGEKLIFVESALVYEANLEDGFDYVINVFCNPDKAILRTVARTGLSEEQVKWRMEEQISPAEKVAFADFNIENNGSLDELKKSTDLILNILKAF